MRCIPPHDPLQLLPTHLRLMAVLELSEAEKEKVGFQASLDGNQRWTNTSMMFDVEFDKANWRHMMKLLKERKTWPTMRETLALVDKMEDAAAQPLKEKDE